MYRMFTGDDGESHIEEMDLAQRPDLGSLTNVPKFGSPSITSSVIWIFTRCRSGG